MKFSEVLHPHRRTPVPLLPTTRRRDAWPSEHLERLMTPREVDDLARGRFVR